MKRKSVKPELLRNYLGILVLIKYGREILATVKHRIKIHNFLQKHFSFAFLCFCDHMTAQALPSSPLH